jgi:hypothetical protein
MMENFLVEGLVLVIAGVLVLGFGVWFGMTRISPRIQRRLDRADHESQETRDRHD